MPKESLSHGIEGEVISVYTVKSIFDGIKKTSGAIIRDTIVSGIEVPISMGNALPLSAV
ncbi:unnamed protein product [Musa banksii]